MPRSDPRQLLDLLRQNPRAAELAAFPFDFDLRRAEHGERVRLASGAPLTGIAGDDTGGTYFLCGDGAAGSVLYADSEGRAGLIAESLAEALELVTGLPGWRDHLELSPGTGADEVTSAAREAETDMRASYAPQLDACREELQAVLGLTSRPPAELFARMHRALFRTEPDALLIGDDGGAYALLDPHPRPSPADTVLAVCRADLDRLRADRGAWPEVAFSPVPGGTGPEYDAHAARRAGVLHAARYDRRVTDLPLLRHLLEQEIRSRRETPVGGMGEELHLAVFLVARFRAEEDLPLLYAARRANFDTWCALSDLPLGLQGRGHDAEPCWEPEALREWVAALDTSEWFGDTPGHDPAETWIVLARRQGRTELARAALIRVLDDIGPADTAELPWIIAEFTALDDFRQAARAQRLYALLQDTEPARAGAYVRLAALERRSGDLHEAGASLRRALSMLDTPPSTDQPALFDAGTTPADSSRRWLDTGLGLDVTEEHFRLAHAAADAGLSALAHQSLGTGKALLDALHQPSLILLRAAQAASLACDDSELATRCADLAGQEESLNPSRSSARSE